MSSQRIREGRINERVQAGAVALATPTDTVQTTATSDIRCHGCLEPMADARVGDQPWHQLCGLYWQGRSEEVRSDRIPHTPAGPGMTPARSRWVIVVPVGRADTYTALRRRFGRSPWVDVLMDRRRGERRHPDPGVPPVERRRTPRRKPAGRPAPPGESLFRLAHQLDGCDVYEATTPESGPCPDCGVLVSLELPRFAEPPVRLELVVRHEVTGDRVRHVGELQSLSATGRLLLSSRLLGRVSHPFANRAATSQTAACQDARDALVVPAT
jgi:hypothetical protein